MRETENFGLKPKQQNTTKEMGILNAVAELFRQYQHTESINIVCDESTRLAQFGEWIYVFGKVFNLVSLSHTQTHKTTN